MDRKLPPQSPEPVAPVGGVQHAAQGNAVWQWAKQALDSTSRMLRKLEVPGLTLQEDETGSRKAPDPAAAMPAPVRDAGTKGQAKRAEKGYDPYEGRAVAKAKPVAKKPVTPVKKPSFLARLFGRS